MSKPTRTLTVYKAKDGWRWRLSSAGHIVAESGEAYSRNSDAVKAARRVFAPDYPVTLLFSRLGSWVTERLR